MSTYLYPKMIKSLIENPQQDAPLIPVTIWEYQNNYSGLTMWAVFYTEEHDIYSSPFTSHPILLWNHGEITTAGEKFIAALKG